MNRFKFIKKFALFSKRLSLSIGLLAILFATDTTYAKTEVLFSPRGAIKDTIIKNIISSKRTIDLTAFTFTAGDIAEALYHAKERGVEVRVVVDQSQNAKNYPVLEFLKEEGFNLQFLKGNIGGSMNNAFAIFDDKLLVTGSYTWTEYAEKFNYENAIFIDEPDVVDKYKKEFEMLHDRGVVQEAKRMEVSALSERNSVMKVVAISNKTKRVAMPSKVSDVSEKTNNGDITRNGKQIKTIEDPLKQFVENSFDEVDNLFGSDSKLDKSEKVRLWKSKFEGKYVKWTGRISFRGFAVYNWNKVGISHKGSSIDVNLKFDYSKQKSVMKLKVGDIITYTGKLVSLSSLLSSYRLEDVDVVQVVR